MMKILITGGGGQLATALFRKLNEDFHVLSYSKETLDVCNLQLVRHRFAADQPRYIFHCAAYTAVDECEKQPNKAFLVNTLGALNVAWATREVGAG
ncbi:NAD-dependent epimerase/dehydratase family protein, partial [Macrococcoides goetzii]